MNQNKKFQVFISSTYTDLVEAREKATKVILDLYHLPVGMEMFSADDDDQWKIITDAIDVSDYYVLIVGHRYGSLTNKGISYTEKEFNYAKSKKIPIISFIRHRDVPVSNSDRESVVASAKKLEKFIEKAKNGKMCSFWKDTIDLERQIAIALPKAFAKHQGIGWVRGNTNSDNIAEEIAKLSDENRKLREKLAEYESKAQIRSPNLTLSINPKEKNSFDFQLTYSDKLSLYRTRKPIIIDELESDIREDLTDQIIEDFNNSLALITEEEIEQYNNIYKKIDLLENSHYPISMFLMNIGNQKASNIHIHITFPSFLMVFDQNWKKDIQKLVDNLKQKSLKIIPTPNYDPVNQFLSRKLVNKLSVGNFGHLSRVSPDLDISSFRNLNSANKDYITDNQSIYIKREEMIHQPNRGYRYDDYFIVPIENGVGTIRIDIICEEYLHQETYEIPVTVNN